MWPPALVVIGVNSTIRWVGLSNSLATSGSFFSFDSVASVWLMVAITVAIRVAIGVAMPIRVLAPKVRSRRGVLWSRCLHGCTLCFWKAFFSKLNSSVLLGQIEQFFVQRGKRL